MKARKVHKKRKARKTRKKIKARMARKKIKACKKWKARRHVST